MGGMDIYNELHIWNVEKNTNQKLWLHRESNPGLPHHWSCALYQSYPVLRSEKRAPANIRRLNNISDVIFYCLVRERSRALALLNAAQVNIHVPSSRTTTLLPLTKS